MEKIFICAGCGLEFPCKAVVTDCAPFENPGRCLFEDDFKTNWLNADKSCLETDDNSPNPLYKEIGILKDRLSTLEGVTLVQTETIKRLINQALIKFTKDMTKNKSWV